MDPVPASRRHLQELLDRGQDALPGFAALDIALIQQIVIAHGGMDWRFVAVLVDQKPGAAPDIEVRDQRLFLEASALASVLTSSKTRLRTAGSVIR